MGYYKRDSGRPSVTWPESVDQALCFGWIDGIRKSLGPLSYTIRLTPRRPGSTWSSVNIRRAGELKRLGLMRAAGLRALAARLPSRSGIYSYEQRPANLPLRYARVFRRDRAAWAFYRGQPPGYRRITTWWIVSAQRESTRLRRLKRLIADSARGLRLAALRRPARR